MSLGESPRAELVLDDYLSIARRRIRWVVAATIVVAVAAGVYATQRAPLYTAASTVLIADSAAQEALDATNANPGLLDRQIENEINLANADATVALVEATLGSVPEDYVTIEGKSSADLLEFEATAESGDEAARWANAWAQAYVTAKQEEAQTSITAAVAQLETRLVDLQEQRQEIRTPLDELRAQLVTTDEVARPAVQARIDRLADDLAPNLQLIDVQIAGIVDSVGGLELSGQVAGAGTARVIQVAAAPKESSSRPLWQILALGTAVGLAVGACIAFLVESLDKTIKTPEDVAEATNLPLLGSIPQQSKTLGRSPELALASRDHPGSAVADGYQRVSAAFQFSIVGRGIKSVLVTSANQSEGKTTTSCNLAYALAGLDNRIALADVDFRRPRLHDVVGVPMQPGLADHLVQGVALDHTVNYLDEDRMLAMLPCGTLPVNPAEFVASAEFVAVLGTLERAADLVVLDAPPLLPVADTLSLARHAGAVILTALSGSTRKSDLRQAAASAQQMGANILGVVLIGVADRGRYGQGGYGTAPASTSLPGRSRRRGADRAAVAQEPSAGPDTVVSTPVVVANPVTAVDPVEAIDPVAARPSKPEPPQWYGPERRAPGPDTVVLDTSALDIAAQEAAVSERRSRLV